MDIPVLGPTVPGEVSHPTLSHESMHGMMITTRMIESPPPIGVTEPRNQAKEWPGGYKRGLMKQAVLVPEALDSSSLLWVDSCRSLRSIRSFDLIRGTIFVL